MNIQNWGNDNAITVKGKTDVIEEKLMLVPVPPGPKRMALGSIPCTVVEKLLYKGIAKC
jgi:hypothetical protein